jgi:3-hydroxyacyl-[acyl-carrier-protein] dehydratase
MRWFLIDKLLECDPGKSAVGVKCYSRSEMFFMDHFAGYPVVPGVLQIEMIAQTGGKCLRLALDDEFTVLGSVKSAKFYKNIEPGDQCIVKVEILKQAKAYAIASGVIEVNGEKMATAEVMYGILPRDRLDKNYRDPVLSDWKKRKGIPE